MTRCLKTSVLVVDVAVIVVPVFDVSVVLLVTVSVTLVVVVSVELDDVIDIVAVVELVAVPVVTVSVVALVVVYVVELVSVELVAVELVVELEVDPVVVDVVIIASQKVVKEPPWVDWQTATLFALASWIWRPSVNHSWPDSLNAAHRGTISNPAGGSPGSRIGSVICSVPDDASLPHAWMVTILTSASAVTKSL